MRTVDGLFDLLVPDPIDRRAFDETMADWREERLHARGLTRLLIDGRWIVALGRVAAGIVAAPFGSLTIWRYLSFSLCTAAVIGMLVNIDMLVRSLTIAGSTRLWLAIVPASTALGLALTAAAGIGLRRGHSVPLPSVAIGMFALLTVLHGWVVPESNQKFREAVYFEFAPETRFLGRGGAELTLPMLVRASTSADDYERTRANRVLLQKAALLSLCVAVIALGEVLRRRLPSRWRWGFVQLASGVTAVGFAVVILAAITPAFYWLPGPVELSTPPFATRWMTAAGLIVIVTIFLARRTPRT